MPTPARKPPREVRRWVPLTAQALLLAGVLYGLARLAGLDWALVVGCGTALVIVMLNDLGRPLPEPAPRRARRPRPAGGE